MKIIHALFLGHLSTSGISAIKLIIDIIHS